MARGGNEMKRPKIYCFSNTTNGGDGMAYAMAEDGTVLGGHLCSHEGYVPHDLGVTPGTRPDRHQNDYSAHYPDGYEMEFIRAADVPGHEGLNAAMMLNGKSGEAAGE